MYLKCIYKESRGIFMKTTTKTKNIKIDNELLTQVEVLCEILHTNFSSKTKELLVEWKIKELKRLKEDAPELFEKYSNNLGNKKAP